MPNHVNIVCRLIYLFLLLSYIWKTRNCVIFPTHSFVPRSAASFNFQPSLGRNPSLPLLLRVLGRASPSPAADTPSVIGVTVYPPFFAYLDFSAIPFRNLQLSRAAARFPRRCCADLTHCRHHRPNNDAAAPAPQPTFPFLYNQILRRTPRPTRRGSGVPASGPPLPRRAVHRATCTEGFLLSSYAQEGLAKPAPTTTTSVSAKFPNSNPSVLLFSLCRLRWFLLASNSRESQAVITSNSK